MTVTEFLNHQTGPDQVCVDCNHSHESHNVWGFRTRCLWCECTRNYTPTP